MKNSPPRHKTQVQFWGLEEYAQAIGTVCIAESHAEGIIEDFIHVLSDPLDDDNLDVLLANMMLRAKAESLKVLAAKHRPNDKTYASVAKELDYLCKDLMPKRNRYCHDQWVPTSPIVQRRERKARVARESGSGNYILRIKETVPCDVIDVWELAVELHRTRTRLRSLLEDYLNHNQKQREER